MTGLYQQTPSPVERIVDTVGAGDGFSAMYMHGLRAAWPIRFA
jgi:fructokinase